MGNFHWLYLNHSIVSYYLTFFFFLTQMINFKVITLFNRVVGSCLVPICDFIQT
uniref:Uncharacterized protein n=1 Tax=Podoviridae sp. ctsNK10 TaxID=2826582 RepID=A0A8S5NKV7_9CAUD|nr:MAG TPA: hypothetical protein [Podoviridae sp. ctsNK10]